MVPFLSMAWFLFCSRNIGFPPSLGFISEFVLAVSLLSYSSFLVLPLGGMAFVAGVYSLLLFSMVQYNKVSGLVISGGTVSGSKTMVVIFLLWVPLNLLIMRMDTMVFSF